MVANAVSGRKGFQSLPLAERFWARVKKDDGCWLWMGGLRDSRPGRDYGMVWVDGRNRSAAQVAWELAWGVPFPQGMDACHHCDVPRCVRPEHIFPGTAADNARDAETKGRLVHDAKRRPISVCRRGGHPYTPENTYVHLNNGWRDCRTCRVERRGQPQ